MPSHWKRGKSVEYQYHPRYFDYAPLLGTAVHAIAAQCQSAVNSIAGTAARVHERGGTYRLEWLREDFRLVLNARGHWKWQRAGCGGWQVVDAGKIQPLHHENWVTTMFERGIRRKYARRGVRFFLSLLNPAPVTVQA